MEAFDAATAAYVERWKRNLKRHVPRTQIIDLPGAGHYVFLTRRDQIARDLREFVAGLRRDLYTEMPALLH
jgi:pimeloyl-ACP methyl ester carboxylesterase